MLFMLGRCLECEESRARCVCPAKQPEGASLTQDLLDAGREARAKLGIFGSMSAAEGVPHVFDDCDGQARCCVVCGRGRLAFPHNAVADKRER